MKKRILETLIFLQDSPRLSGINNFQKNRTYHFFWAAHDFGQVKWTQNWSREAASSTLLTRRMAIPRKRNELLEIPRCQNDRIFEGFSDFQKNIEFLDFCMTGFLDFCIFLDFWSYLGNEKSYHRSAGVKTTGFLRAFPISPKMLNFWISG